MLTKKNDRDCELIFSICNGSCDYNIIVIDIVIKNNKLSSQ